MPTETLQFENARLAQQLFNNDPRNLQALEEQLGVKAVARENWIKLDGPDDALERARELFQSLEGLVEKRRGGAPARVRPGPERGQDRRRFHLARLVLRTDRHLPAKKRRSCPRRSGKRNTWMPSAPTM